MMKRMKKRLALALAVSIAAFSAFGCSSGGTSAGGGDKVKALPKALRAILLPQALR